MHSCLTAIEVQICRAAALGRGEEDPTEVGTFLMLLSQALRHDKNGRSACESRDEWDEPLVSMEYMTNDRQNPVMFRGQHEIFPRSAHAWPSADCMHIFSIDQACAKGPGSDWTALGFIQTLGGEERTSQVLPPPPSPDG